MQLFHIDQTFSLFKFHTKQAGRKKGAFLPLFGALCVMSKDDL